MRFAVKNLRASRVNLMMNDYACGIPSPMSFLGLAESVARDLGLAPWTARVLPILHSVHPSEGRTKPEMEAKGSSFSPIEMIEDMHGLVTASLILDLPGCESESDVAGIVARKRIAGGAIHNKKIVVENAEGEGNGLQRLPRGYALVRPLAEELRVISSGDLGKMEAIAKLLFPAERSVGSGWNIAVAVGHRLLEDPNTAPKRSRSRNADIPHVFVEPCVGIAQCLSVRNPLLAKASHEAFGAHLWSWHVEDGFVLGHRDYSPRHH